MVTITAYNHRESKDGRPFLTLQISGGVELVKSQTTGAYYATTRSCSIPCTFDESVAKQLVGSQMPGEIVKMETETYEFLSKTGETMMLNYTYAYQASPEAKPVGSSKVEEHQTA